MAVQTVRTVTRPAIDLTALAVAADVAGDSWVNTGAQLVAVTNGSVSPITVTEVYAAALAFDGATPTPKTYSVLAGHTALLGPFNPALFNDPTTNRASITYSAVATVTVCVFTNGAQ